MTVAAAVEAEEIAEELFRTTEGRTDPYPRYHRIRELAPVFRSETAYGWLLSRYDDCFSALRDPRLGKDYAQRMDTSRPWWRERPSLLRGEFSMLNTDGPYHTRLRRLVSKNFTFRNVELMRESIEKMVDELLEPLADKGSGDLISELTFPLPVTVIGELLGVPKDDRPQFRELVQDITAIFEVRAGHERFDAADKATLIVDDYFYALIDEKRQAPTDDLLSRLVNDNPDDRLNDEELVTLASLLFAAGFETTTNLIGNGMLGLLKQPEQIQLLRDEPEHYEQLSDELLRYDGTAQMVIRQAKEDYEVGGQTIPAGETAIMMIAAGNHDPARYEDPDKINLRRSDIRPLSFGGGVHFCIGAALARAEVEVVFKKLFDRFPVIEFDGEPPTHRDRLTLRGLPALPLAFRTSGSVSTRTAAAAPATRVAPEPAIAADGVLPPRPSGEADTEWRRTYREHIERDALEKSAEELASTIALLRRVPLFVGCTGEELHRLAETAYPIAFDPGDVLCVEGSHAPECYVVSEGEAVVTMGGSVVATVSPDDVVGEKGPLEDRPRAATVTARTHMVTYAISKDELARLLEASPTAAEAMRAELARRYG